MHFVLPVPLEYDFSRQYTIVADSVEEWYVFSILVRLRVLITGEFFVNLVDFNKFKGIS